MVLGPCEEAGPKDQIMVDAGQLKLKRARSPPTVPQPLSSSALRGDRGKGPATRMAGLDLQQPPHTGMSPSVPLLLLPPPSASGKASTPGKEVGGGELAVPLGAKVVGRSSTSPIYGLFFQGEKSGGRTLLCPVGGCGEVVAEGAAKLQIEGGREALEKGELPMGAQHTYGEISPRSGSNRNPEHNNMEANDPETAVEENRVAQQQDVMGCKPPISHGRVVSQLKAALQAVEHGSKPLMGIAQGEAAEGEAVFKAVNHSS